MKRRDFIHYTLLSSAALGAASVLGRARADVPVNDKRVLLFLMLRGGPRLSSLDRAALQRRCCELRWGPTGATGGGHTPSVRAKPTGKRVGKTTTSPSPRGRPRLGSSTSAVGSRRSSMPGTSPSSTIHWRRRRAIITTPRSSSRVATAPRGPNDRTRDGWGGRLAQTVEGRVVSDDR